MSALFAKTWRVWGLDPATAERGKPVSTEAEASPDVAERKAVERELAEQLARKRRKPRAPSIGVLRSVPRDAIGPMKPARMSPLAMCLLGALFVAGLDVAQARYACQSFKEAGHFFYGMDVDRCTRTLVLSPAISFDEQLAVLNETY